MTYITLPKFGALSMTNPTPGMKFNNLEEKINEYISMYGHIPVKLSRSKDALSAGLPNIIGKLVSNTDTGAVVELTELGEHMSVHGIPDAILVFCCSTDTGANGIGSITSADVFCRKAI